MMRIGRLRLIAVGLLALVLAASSASAATCPSIPDDAFTFITPDDNGVCPTNPGVHWDAATVAYDCSFFANAAMAIDCKADAATCVDICRAAAHVWNTQLSGRFTFVEASQPVAFCNTNDGATSIGGTTTLCDGSAYGRFVLAITLSIFSTQHQPASLIDANITVNQAFNFFFDQTSFQATIAHELGHVLGLTHPDEPVCGKDFNVLMRSAEKLQSDDPCYVRDPTSADLNGAERIYPVLAATPTPSVTPGLCGDADLNGTLTVSDGVQTLRAAAGLSSDCTLDRCDVDGSRSITVTDGVDILRAAAGLSFPAACPN